MENLDAVNDAGTTVQVITFHPFHPTSILLVHNMLEDAVPGMPFISMYNGKVKPAGWGNGGGGMEKDELEKLMAREPRNPILTDPSFATIDDKMVAACGLRELQDESGYRKAEIRMPDGGVKLLEYFLPNGHRVVTIWGEVKSLVYEPIVEFNEVDIADWFDLSVSLPNLFRNRNKRPGLPYWSHVRRILIGISRIDGHYRRNGEPWRCVGSRIHPSWRLVFSVGAGDPRFPRRGYRIYYKDWYSLIEEMIDNKVEMLNNDAIYCRFKEKIDLAVLEENKETRVEATTEEEKTEPVAVSGNDDDNWGDSVSELEIPAEIAAREDEEWRIWMEKELGLK